MQSTPVVGKRKGSPITHLESSTRTWVVKHLARDVSNFSQRHAALGDNLSVILTGNKGRSSAPGMQCRCRVSAAHILATQMVISDRWLMSERNPADQLSRIYSTGFHRQLFVTVPSAIAAQDVVRPNPSLVHEAIQRWRLKATELLSKKVEPTVSGSGYGGAKADGGTSSPAATGTTHSYTSTPSPSGTSYVVVGTVPHGSSGLSTAVFRSVAHGHMSPPPPFVQSQRFRSWHPALQSRRWNDS